MSARSPTINERHGYAILERYQRNLPVEPHASIPLDFGHHKHGIWPPPHFKVGIVGAGAAGLYTAMILQDLGI